MLATQTCDGDLRVWSVSKPATLEIPRTIRVLKRADTTPSGSNWIAWSKNGRIVQYSDRETWTWDVRTKHVTYEPVPTVEDLRGLACYGPSAALFTLGPSNSVQQYDLERPQIVAHVHHPNLQVPPTPPLDDDRQLGFTSSENEDDLASPIRSANQELKSMSAARFERNRSSSQASPRSHRSRTHSASSKNSSTRAREREAERQREREHEREQELELERQRMPPPPQPVSATRTESNTAFSAGTTPQYAREPMSSTSLTYATTLSPASTRGAGRKSSRLRQEVLRSPDDKPLRDLFPFTRSRLSDVPNRPMRNFDESRLTPDDLRKQMLSVVFGWDADIYDLVRDEIARHPQGSQNAILLCKWLDDDPNAMAGMIGLGGNLDWMMLALSNLGNTPAAKKMVQTFIEKMLAKGDIHAAATILLSLGEHNEAIEVYVERNLYMEAVLLTCLATPHDWQRQSFLVRRWGEHVVENSQQSLAIRCFSCTGVESSEPWTSPTAQQATMFPLQQALYQASVPSIREYAVPATTKMIPSPLNPDRLSSPSMKVKHNNAALKLITSFTPADNKSFRFPGLKSDDQTPTNVLGVTPIAESAAGDSAMTPGGFGSYRSNNAYSLSKAMRIATPGGYARARLPSIGETPGEVTPATSTFSVPRGLPTPDNSGSENEKARENLRISTIVGEDSTPQEEAPFMLLSSASYIPAQTPVDVDPVTAIASQSTMSFQNPERTRSAIEVHQPRSEPSKTRGISKTRKPDGLSIQMVPVTENSEEPVTFSRVNRTKSAVSYSTTNIDTQSEVTSPPVTGQSYQFGKSPTIGRSIDDYINSLDAAQGYHASVPLANDERSERRRHKTRLRAPSEEDRGRGSRKVIPQAKRSPSSPVPMSPEDVTLYHTASTDSLEAMLLEMPPARPRSRSRPSKSKSRAESKTGERRRHRSSSRNAEGRSRIGSRATSRRPQSPERQSEYRGRPKTHRSGSALRSPSSPRPMSPSSGDQFETKPTPSRHRQRSSSRRADEAGRSRGESHEGQRTRARAASVQNQDADVTFSRKLSTSQRNRDRSADRQLHTETSQSSLGALIGSSGSENDRGPGVTAQQVIERRRKELAAAELEARRLSLARRPSAPPIPMPGHINSAHMKSFSLGQEPPVDRTQSATSPPMTSPGSFGQSFDRNRIGASPPMSTDSSFAGRMYARTSPGEIKDQFDRASDYTPSLGLPATPRAMRHPGFGDNRPEVPDLPDNMSLLSGSVYRPDNELPRSMSAPPEQQYPQFAPIMPLEIPHHPAYNVKLPNSRARSRTRENRRRDRSADRSRISPSDASDAASLAPSVYSTHTIGKEINPPILPELQHLASPPPPPPPPSVPGHEMIGDGRLPSSTYDRSTSSNSHRRADSTTSHDKAGSKIKGWSSKIRSSSRTPSARSPTVEGPSPYETIAV